jgi:hypothetical protein
MNNEQVGFALGVIMTAIFFMIHKLLNLRK